MNLDAINERILEALIAKPLRTCDVMQIIGKSRRATHKRLNRLMVAGYLTRISKSRNDPTSKYALAKGFTGFKHKDEDFLDAVKNFIRRQYE